MALDKIQLLALIDDLFRTGVPDNVTAAGLRQAFKETVEFAEAGSFENIDFEYDPEATYNTTDKKYAEANGRLYKSKREGNTGNPPPDEPDPVSGDYENFWWVEISKNDGILQVYRAGLYGAGTVIVFYNYQGEKIEWQGVKFWELNLPEGDRPFESVDINAEIEEETAVWIPAQKVGGGGSSETAASIKTKYESNDDTNAFTDAQKDKLAGVAAGATKNDNTDELDEGETNKYFTESRSIGSKLAGYLKAVSVTAISSATSILQAIGILEKAIDGKVDKVAGSGLISDAEKAIYADKYTKNETDNLVSSAVNSIIWKEDVATFADLATTFPAAVEGWTSIVNSENKMYRYDGSAWVSIGDASTPLATALIDGKISSADFVKLRDIEAEATKNTNTDELDEGSNNKYFTDVRAVAAKITGYVRASESAPVAETDSILQALGKLDKGFDNKLSIQSSAFVSLFPGGLSADQALSIARSSTPNGQPKSATNRFSIYVYAGEFIADNLTLDTEFVDIIGVGPKESIRFIPIDTWTFTQTANNIRLENFTSDGVINVFTTETSATIFRSLVVSYISDGFGSYPGAFSGLYENIIGTYQWFEAILTDGPLLFGTFRNVNNIFGLGLTISPGTFENCLLGVGGSTEGATINNCIINSLYTHFINSKISNSIFRRIIEDNSVALPIVTIGEGTEMSYCRIIHDGIDPSPGGYQGGGFAIWSGFNDNDDISTSTAKIHHCTIEAENLVPGMVLGAFDERIINLIENGHNSWDTDGDGSGGDHAQDIADLQDDVLSLQKEYVVDIDFVDVEDFIFKAPENLIIYAVEAQPGTIATVTGYTVGSAINKYSTFTISVDAPGLVTLKGERQ